MSTVASLTAAAAVKNPEAVHNGKLVEQQFDSIVEMVVKTLRKETKKNWPTKILWVDDHPDNNIYERQAFGSIGITFHLARSTDEALDMISRNKYSAIISDMGRKEGDDEGYVLLEEFRKQDKTTPYFIYAGSNEPEHKRMAKKKKAQGSTNSPQELYQMITSYLSNGS
jgi:CheY-like chemotaxis protein